MADPKKKNEYLYNTGKLSVIFGISSIVLFIVIISLVVDDYAREWKKYQRSFNQMQLTQAAEDLEKLNKKSRLKKLAKYEKQLKEEQAIVEESKEEIEAKEKTLVQLDKDIYKLKSTYQVQKANFEAARYTYEEHMAHSEDHLVEGGEEKKKLKEDLEAWTEKVNVNGIKLDELKFQREVIQAEIDQTVEKRKKAEAKLNKLKLEEKTIKEKMKSLKPGIFNTFRNSPLFDFISPTLKIRQVVLDDLHDDLSFVKVPKIDRCTTCHLAIDTKGFEDAPQPFRTHPKLDLFVSSDSPHAMEAFGCTTCHSGNGQAIDFYHTAHEPHSEEQAHEWEEKYDWHPIKHWAHPMLSLQNTEASCVKCHNQQLEIPEAPIVNEGRRLFEDMGCIGCHEVKGTEEIRKAGPDLRRLGGKVDPGWTAKWLKNPKAFRPDTTMPSFFGLSNAESVESEDVQIDAITTYLFSNATEFVPEEITGVGVVDTGKRLVEEIGCLGCHSVEENEVNSFAPTLSQIGSKVNFAWLVDWIKNPKHYNPNTNMPSLRLTDQEALDIASYLMTLKNTEFETMDEPESNAEILDALVKEELREKMIPAKVEEKFKTMSEEDKKLYLGERLINFYGCFACHDIAGFEDASRIGAELTEESGKPIAQFDFGFVEAHHTHKDFYNEKLKNPRVFDRGKIKLRKEKLRMPQFNLNDEERNALITYLLALKKDDVLLSKQYLLSPMEKQAEAGRRIIRDSNCMGCHEVETDMGGDLKQYQEDPIMAPPSLVGEGKRVQGKWFHEFLEEPSIIRPWLKYRMPSFDFTEEELDVVIKHFRGKDEVEETFGETYATPTRESLVAGKLIFEQLSCIQCHDITDNLKGVSEEASSSELAPNLLLSRDRLRHEWIIDWLSDPEGLMPGTTMPSFFPEGFSPLPDILEGDAMKQMVALRDYVINLPEEE